MAGGHERVCRTKGVGHAGRHAYDGWGGTKQLVNVDPVVTDILLCATAVAMVDVVLAAI